MVQELRRVTLLWEELWLGTLNQQQTDVQRRLAQLSNEIKRVESNRSLNASMKDMVIREKHRTIMKPVSYYVLNTKIVNLLFNTKFLLLFIALYVIF